MSLYKVFKTDWENKKLIPKLEEWIVKSLMVKKIKEFLNKNGKIKPK